MAGEGAGLFSADTLRTIFVWQIAAQVIGAMLAPFIEQMTEDVNARTPVTPLSPADAADMVLRGWMDKAAGQEEAKKSGLSADKFDLLVNDTGEPPATELLLEAFRRGFLPFEAAQGEPSVSYGIRTSRVRNEWIPLLQQMRFTVPGAADVIDGFVKGHIDEATAKQKFSEAGLNPETDWDWLAFTRGNPPGLADVAKLVHRGLVPKDGVGPGAVSFEQAVRESAYMDKWSTPLFEGFTYVPPVRTIVALLRADAISADRGRTLFAENGVRPEDADAYIAEATQTKVAADKELAKGDVETLYYDQAIDNATASQMLQALGYRNGVDQYLLTLVDLRREMAIVHAATSKIGNYYIARKIDKATASGALDALSIPAQQRDQLIAGWDIARTANVKLLSPTDIADAFKYGIIDQGTAQDNLVADGYTPYDAWVYLSVKMHGPLPDPPPQDQLIPA